MEKKNLSAVDISKKLIWEYIIASFFRQTKLKEIHTLLAG